ncbi:hypothetical protein GH714_016941 [Hevea brasiliensis]|uniref:C2 domain-containing protein n=1 Tax=Hevea brasiliensis TaxID=3981 RepID=A0A6A6KRS5_HEVBR|nr:hypothetical protein GH714_016941 [Hevea brasiliensis]
MSTKLTVEVLDASDLMPKDGQGSANPFVQVSFDEQRQRTQTKPKDLNPYWNEKLVFTVNDPRDLPSQTIEVVVYHDRTGEAGHEKNFLGRVRISGVSVPLSESEASVQRCPLEKRGLFSNIKGDIALKIYAVHDGTAAASGGPAPAPAPALATPPPPPPPPMSSGFGFETHLMKEKAPTVEARTDYARAGPATVMQMQFPKPNPEFALVETSPPVAARMRYRAGDKTASTYDLVEQMRYLYVNVVKARDLPVMDVSGSLDPYVEVKLGNYKGRTKHLQKNQNPVWNQIFAFSKDRIQANILEVTVKDKDLVKDDFVGRVFFDLLEVPLRVPPDSPLAPQWYKLVDKKGDKTSKGEIMLAVWMGTQADEAFPEAWHSDAHDIGQTNLNNTRSKVYFTPKLYYLRVHVIEAQDLFPSEKGRMPDAYVKVQLGGQLRITKPLRTINPVWNEEFMFVASEPLDDLIMCLLRTGLDLSKDGRTTDAYCVAKYGNKWVRTRTLLDNLHPRWNEQYTWDVHDPCTVITIGVFDNCHINGSKEDARDQRIGKVRIRLSTLENDRIYTHYYPLLVLHPSGLKKHGEIQLALRFTCTAWVNMITQYGKPLLPKMHYLQPIPVMLIDWLRHQAIRIIAARLGRAEPPLRPEIVEYMLDKDHNMWSLRRSKANFGRIMKLLTGVAAVCKWFNDICTWRNPVTTCMVYVVFLMLVCYPELILPTIFLYLFVIGMWNYRIRPRQPPHMDIRLSQADNVHPDELDEEFDTFPTSRPADIVRMRYDRLRSIAGRVQTVVGDLASQGERAQAILSWRDPRATAIFIIFSLIWAVFIYITPFQVVAVLVGLYLLRHPRFRSKMPSAPVNFFRRLPSKSDQLL